MRPVSGLAIVLVTFVSGCATVPLPPPADIRAAWVARQSALEPVTAWHIRGRLALRAGEQGWHATLDWRRDGDNHRLDLTGPLGRGHLRLVQDSNGAELSDADRRVWHAADAGLLLYRATGWVVPLDGMNYWVLGLPVPGPAPDAQLDAQGRLKRLTQSGWEIRFLEYVRHDSLELPSRMDITRLAAGSDIKTADDETLELRLRIEQWVLKGTKSEE